MVALFSISILKRMCRLILLSVLIISDISSAVYRDIRLTSDSSLHKGTLHVLKDDSWGTVCGDNWNKINSDVACRHLGFPNASSVTVEDSRFGTYRGDIWMGDVQCNGDEIRIWDCPHKQQPQNCNHRQDIGLICQIPGYLGCFGNNASDWVLNAGHFRSTVLTTKTCLEFCKKEGFPLAGLQNGADCYCGNDQDDYDRVGQFEDEACSARCTGDRQEACGGVDKISVYNVSESFCDDLDAPPGGWFQGDSMFFGHTLTFGCNNGVKLIGNDVIQCVLGDQPHEVRWSAPAPYCFGVTASPLTPKANAGKPSSGKSLLQENAVIIWSIAGVAVILLVVTLVTVTLSIRSMNKHNRTDPDQNSIDFDLEPAGPSGTYRHSIHSLHLLGHLQENTENDEQEQQGKSAMYLQEEVKGGVGMQTNALSIIPTRSRSAEDLEWDEDLDSELEIDPRTSTMEHIGRTAL